MLNGIMRDKLCRDNGESLAEVLVSVLIIAVGLVLLSSLVIASSKMVDKGNTKMKALYDGKTAVETQKNAVDGDKTMTIVADKAGMTAKVTVTAYEDKDSGLMAYVKK